MRYSKTLLRLKVEAQETKGKKLAFKWHILIVFFKPFFY